MPGANLNSGKYSEMTGTGGKDSSSQKATMNPLEFLGSLVGKKGTVVSGKIEGKSKIGPIDISGSLEGEGPGYSIERTGKGKLSSKDGKYSLGFEDGLKGEVHLFQGKGTWGVGPVHGEVSGGVRRATVTGTIGTTLFKDGKFSPAIQGKLKGKVSVLDGKIGYRIGSKDYNYHTSADGSLVTAEGEISVGAGKIKWTDKNGVEHQGYGVQGKIGGEAYLAKGKVTGGYTIMGIKIDVGVSGGVGGGGASIGGQITADGASGTIGGGVLVGGDLNVSIDWSNFKIPKLPKLPKGLDPRSLLA